MPVSTNVDRIGLTMEAGAVSCIKQTSCAPINSLLVFDAHYSATDRAVAALAFAAATDTVATECTQRPIEIIVNVHCPTDARCL